MADGVEKVEPPIPGQVASSTIGRRMAPYIGELDPDPRRPFSRYAYAERDEQTNLRLYRETLRDERCQAALEQRLDACVSRPWEVLPGGPRRIDAQAAEDLALQLHTVRSGPIDSQSGIDQICRQLLHAVWYGYSVAEAIWMRDGARVVMPSLRVRAVDRWRFTAEGELLLRTESAPQGEMIPAAKFLCVARPGEHSDLPHGPGLARWCFWPAWLKRNGAKFWAIALEKFAAPTPVGKYRRGATSPEVDNLVDLLAALAGGAGIAIPEGQDIELIESVRRSGPDFQEFCGYMDRLITNTILRQSSTTDQGQWRGTAEVQLHVRDETIAADVRMLDAALNSTIVRWLTQWNFPGAAMPIFHRDGEPRENLNERAKREAVVARMSGLRPTEKHVMAVYGGEWERPPEPQPPAGGPGPAGMRFARDTDRDEIAAAAAEMADEWEPLMEPAVQPILEAADKADTFEEFRGRLAEVAVDTSRVQDRLHRGAFSAQLSGAAGLTEEDD